MATWAVKRSTTINPVLEEFRARGINLIGPLPADTLFTPKHLQGADAVLAMYHDQGLPVLKYQGFGRAANITLGLLIIRTSVDHGTALDLAATGGADNGSLQTAIEVAAKWQPEVGCLIDMQHQARKRFGQNFLVDQQIISQIVSAIGASESDNLIEIGPGTAAITEHLVKQCPSMKVVELDRDLVSFLTEKFAAYPDFTIFSGDALRTDLPQFHQGRQMRLVGNLPYNILHAAAVSSARCSPADPRYALYVAAGGGRASRRCAWNQSLWPALGNGSVSLSRDATNTGSTRGIRPAPKVQSAIVRLKPHSEKPFVAEDEGLLSQLVSHSFQQRRKTLRNCLAFTQSISTQWSTRLISAAALNSLAWLNLLHYPTISTTV